MFPKYNIYLEQGNPSRVSVDAMSPSSLYVNWNQASGHVDGYTVFYSSDGSEINHVYVEGGESEFTIINQLEACRTYTVYVMSVKEGMEGHKTPSGGIQVTMRKFYVINSLDQH